LIRHQNKIQIIIQIQILDITLIILIAIPIETLQKNTQKQSPQTSKKAVCPQSPNNPKNRVKKKTVSARKPNKKDIPDITKKVRRLGLENFRCPRSLLILRLLGYLRNPLEAVFERLRVKLEWKEIDLERIILIIVVKLEREPISVVVFDSLLFHHLLNSFNHRLNIQLSLRSSSPSSSSYFLLSFLISSACLYFRCLFNLSFESYIFWQY